jgi:thiamine-phosphate pyrophosphorylase
MSRVNFRLYLVTDRQLAAGRSTVSLVRESLEAGLRAVQLRERDLDTPALLRLAEDLLHLAHDRQASLLINDRVDLVLALAADGVHLRADSIPVAATRRVLGPRPLIGASAHSVDEVLRAEADGADFVVFGPIYPTASKRAYGPPIGLASLEAAACQARIPVFAIGGISIERVAEVRRAGAFGVAVISAILAAPNVAQATKQLLSALQ